MPGWLRYELREDNGFWAIKLTRDHFGDDSEALITTRQGAVGRERKMRFETYWEAAEQFGNEVISKLQMGFRLALDSDTAHSARDAALESRVVLNDEDADYLVYADWLQSQGDPRGELIVLSNRLESKPSETKVRKALRKAKRGLLEKYPSYLVPPHLASVLKEPQTRDPHAAIPRTIRVAWRNGFIRQAEIFSSSAEINHLLHDILLHPAGRFIRELTVGLCQASSFELPIDALVHARPLALRKLSINCQGGSLGDTSELWQAVPNLKELSIHTEPTNLGPICKAQWPQLETLNLGFGPYLTQPQSRSLIRPILDGRGLPKLKRLGLLNAPFSNETYATLGSAKILSQLEYLDLSDGNLGDEGARALVENAERFAHLIAIDVGENFLTQKGVVLLSQMPTRVEIRRQKDPETVGEDQYFFGLVGKLS